MSFAVKTVALEGAKGGSRGKGKKRTRSGASPADEAGQGCHKPVAASAACAPSMTAADVAAAEHA